jgi:hypothetical protein
LSDFLYAPLNLIRCEQDFGGHVVV